MKATATPQPRDLKNGIRHRLAPRLRLEPTLSRLALLDGAWWPRSAHPDTELPDLVLALDNRRGPITHLLFDADEWDEHPRRLLMAGRRVRLGWSKFSPPNLMIAVCDNPGVEPSPCHRPRVLHRRGAAGWSSRRVAPLCVASVAQ